MEPDRTVLARTWNGNESGRLWTREWCRDGEGLYALLIASGVFAEPMRFESEAAFWQKFKSQRAQFNGARSEDA